jgi:hypothetical protein
VKKRTLGLGVLAIVLGVISILPNVTSAYRGDPSIKGPNYSSERHEAMLKAFENRDYSAWANLMQGRGRVTQVVNKDNFAKFAEAHKLAQQGKTVEAQKIRQELGLGLHNGFGQGRWANR